jgi:Na+-translocating ferredoxin:NAD+ oxidoreductase RNF subunit RnfB
MHTGRRSTALTATALALTATFGAAPANAQTGGGANNLVQVVNTAGGAFAHRAGVQAAPYGGDSAQSTNLARAESRDCTGCTTHAAALQAVFLTGNPDTVQVANAAVATNSACSQCLTYAYAFQYVITTERAVSLSPEGQQRIHDIQRRASAVVAQPSDSLDDFAAFDAQLQALAAELRDTVDSELRTAGHAATARSYQARESRSS